MKKDIPPRIRFWLPKPERKIEEIEYFWRHMNGQSLLFEWEEIESKEQLKDDLIWPVKEIYDEALGLLVEEKIGEFLHHWRAVAGELFAEEDGEIVQIAGEKEDYFRARIFSCVHELEWSGSLRRFDNHPWIGGEVTIFRLIDGRGNDDFRWEDPTRREAVDIAETLIDRIGPRHYRVREGNQYSQKLLDDVADMCDVSDSTIRRRFRAADWDQPTACHGRLKRRR